MVGVWMQAVRKNILSNSHPNESALHCLN
jgi:hypothetical protein